MATDIVGSNVRHLLYLPIVVLLAKMLPQEARREFISWISDFKFQGRARRQTEMTCLRVKAFCNFVVQRTGAWAKQEDFGGADRASVAVDADAEENTVTNMYSWFFSFAYTE